MGVPPPPRGPALAEGRCVNVFSRRLTRRLTFTGEEMRKTRKQRQRDRRQTKGLTSSTMYPNVYYAPLFISQPSFATQQREMTNFQELWRP